MQIQVYFCTLHFRLSLTRNYSDNIVTLHVNKEETCKLRQENELQAIQVIYMDDFQDLREKREDPPKVCLNLTPLQSVVGKEVYARVDLIVQYTKHYPNKSPKLSLSNAKGISNEDVSELQKELQQMAAELVGEVMVLNLAHHVQTFLHTRNQPQLSFYEKMMVNKKEEEERLQAAEQEKRLMEFEAKKEREENEKREIEEVLQRREEAVKESRRRRVITVSKRIMYVNLIQLVQGRALTVPSRLR